MYTRNCEIKVGIEFPPSMRRVALGVEYAGSEFHGFQRQLNSANTVQAHLEKVLSKIACETITTVCAGRTDTGVSACAQVLHFDTLAERPEKAWVRGVNTELPDGIRVLWSQETSPEFHARFSARARTYRYLFRWARVRSALMPKSLSWFKQPLNVDAMQQAATCLLGEHNFSAFRSAQCQAKHAIREIQALNWGRQGDIHFMEIKANAFLHHMVRNIFGTLVEVGVGKQKVEWVEKVLQQGDRRLAGETAQPWGLYFVEVDYDPGFQLPRLAKGPLFLDRPD